MLSRFARAPFRNVARLDGSPGRVVSRGRPFPFPFGIGCPYGRKGGKAPVKCANRRTVTRSLGSPRPGGDDSPNGRSARLYRLPLMPSPSFRIETFRGTAAGWAPASPAVVTAETAARRLRLYRAVRGDTCLYRAAPVLPGETAETARFVVSQSDRRRFCCSAADIAAAALPAFI